ncbi:DNA glycosylase [uncultured Candidatus Kuenenia sp.]|uniref:DNA-3-methyladenine glycosylase family protein n=1 Tax=uncultured Candidatus Kuenenia sp. TaxID=1048336 RepID=UPI0003040905|nr:DNA glycosylase [uncultured Candidatus Kuenenia sp.]
MPKLAVKDFNLSHTLLCGQLFRVKKIDDWFYVAAKNRIFKIRQLSEHVEYYGVGKKFLTNFFALDEPYGDILSQINKDSHMNSAIGKFYGLRIVRQDSWECLISFMCSSAANIPKIQLNLENLSEYFGEKVRLHDFEWHTFPRPGKLDDYQQILMAKTGFRAVHIKKANDTINDAFLTALNKLPYPEAKKALLQIPGVGNKIADCVLLFSLGFSEAFPIDTWIKKILQRLYFKDETVSNNELHTFGVHYFGKYAGYAQQFLYMLARENK